MVVFQCCRSVLIIEISLLTIISKRSDARFDEKLAREARAINEKESIIKASVRLS